MDTPPEPTVVTRTLQDFNKFLCSGTNTQEPFMGRARQLNFSDSLNDTSSTLDDDSRNGGQGSRKRNLDSLAGFDITKKFREKDVEIVTAKTMIKRLEGRLQGLDTSSKKARLERDTELEALRHKELRDKELIEDLQHKLKKLQKQEWEVKQSSNKVRQECDAITLETETKMMKKQQQYLEKCHTLQEEISVLNKKLLEMSKDVDEKTTELHLAKSHADQLEMTLTEVQNKLKESVSSQMHFETQKLELNQAKVKIKELQQLHRDSEALEDKAEVFEAAVRKMSVMEKEMSNLKEENEFFKQTERNTKLIEEKLSGAQLQVTLLEKRCKENAHFEAENDMFKETLRKYETIIYEEFGLDHKVTPQDLQFHITKLKKGDQSLTNGLAQLRASQKSLENRYVSEEAEIKVLKAKLEKQAHNTQHNAVLIKRLQRKLFLVTKERDSLKEILTSYESEITINHSVVSQERIIKLEDLMKMYKEELERLEKELDASCNSITNETQVQEKFQRKEDAKKISSLEKNILELQAEVTKVTQAKEILDLRLENRALKGDYDPLKTKVLHFENNPLSKAIESRGTEIHKLQTENKALREHVLQLEQGTSHIITPKVGIKVSNEAHSSKELTELQEKSKFLETRNKRLLEVFKRKSLDMREVVYQLTGYRVDASGDNQYKLINMYAESPDDYLIFEQTPSKELQFLETDFSNTLEDLIDAYLRHENSYPAFLSAVTLDLFNRQTVEQPASSSDAEEEDQEDDDEDAEVEPEDAHRMQHQDDGHDELVILD
ncbi:mitotic spindle assembly checkpoint protein MAD1-like [Homarus americanus]|uniref:mitotic spindle assembly checkpoint protein MAD1-like n=1 Tax=Homarus americanus TaxID=6706 RepID=UPI001C489193|nr:mitotic spindle assembly checkpoint protein MAD1-like [Homarus americanus]